MIRASSFVIQDNKTTHGVRSGREQLCMKGLPRGNHESEKERETKREREKKKKKSLRSRG